MAFTRQASAPNALSSSPAKPERFGEAEALARAEGVRVVGAHGTCGDSEPRADAVVLDMIGSFAHRSGSDGRLRRRSLVD